MQTLVRPRLTSTMAQTFPSVMLHCEIPALSLRAASSPELSREEEGSLGEAQQDPLSDPQPARPKWANYPTLLSSVSGFRVSGFRF